ncbi:MAG: L-glutamate gamma-semialdehyde dehydrogenase [Planctomycetes bacterium]|nr:L-glutamate gamma-semialdehyde dehydrogenase [Planctomycetota bacterium]
MTNFITKPPVPRNEPVKAYAPGSPERAELKAALRALRSEVIEIPLLIGGREVATGDLKDVVEPHDHRRVLARAHMAREEHVEQAILACRRALAEWSAMSFDDRAAVFLKMAELLAGPWRQRVNAATMLGQSKTPFQAEIDSACELIDFYRFNVAFARQILELQPDSAAGTWNRCEYRNLEGFVLAVTPFNFTSIAGNLPTAPAIMGNVSIWKPSSTSLYSNYLLMKMWQEAGLPDGVINFLPGPGRVIGRHLLPHEDLAGIHFTGSTDTFHLMWRTVGENLGRYRNYPRIVGETGGKDFVFAHASADAGALTTALLRGAFEYQGQKCSAASRAYVPRSLWGEVRERLAAEIAGIKMGDPSEFDTFMGAVIDEAAFDNTCRYVEGARRERSCAIVAGGGADKSRGYFIEPTVIETADPRTKTMCEEIFAPVLTVFPYEDARLEEALELCDTTSPYALTGAVFARDRAAIARIAAALRHAAGNFYINDKPTGAVVGQQPFGGGRASGTNDKAGSLLNLLRWTSVRTIKENLLPPDEWRYPHMAEA